MSPIEGNPMFGTPRRKGRKARPRLVVKPRPVLWEVTPQGQIQIKRR